MKNNSSHTFISNIVSSESATKIAAAGNGDRGYINRFNPRLIYAAHLAICALFLIGVSARADGIEPESIIYTGLDARLIIGIAAGVERFDTNFRFTDKTSSLPPVYLDGEGSIGLPTSKVVPIFYGAFQFAERHAVGFSYFKIKRTATLLAIDEEIGDALITGNVSLSDKSSFSYINYGYTLYGDDRSRIRAMFGLYGIDLKYSLDANGQISIEGLPPVTGTYSLPAEQFVPLPMIGVDMTFGVTPRWSAGTKFGIVGGTYKDVSAILVEAVIRARYQMSKHVALNIGANYLSADVDIDKSDELIEIGYGFDGLFLGLDWNW